MKQPQHIPTLIALLILIIGIGGAIFLIENGTRLFSQARSSRNPRQVTISNVTDTSFTVSWVTDAAVVSLLRYGKRSALRINSVAYDTRDQTGQLTPRQIHAITVSGLEPNTDYAFEIISANNTYKDKEFIATTGSPLPPLTQNIPDPAFGTLLDQRNNVVNEALVFASFDGSQTISSLVYDGAWILPISGMRSRDGERYFVPSDADTEKLLFVGSESQSNVTTTINNDSPLLPVRLGEDYTFTEHNQSSSLFPALIIAQAADFGSVSGDAQAASVFQITTPQKDAGIPSTKLQIKGIGITKKAVIITISGNNTALSGKVVVDGNGRWSWQPPQSLNPGTYTLTAVSFDETDQALTLSQSFMVFKSGTQVLQAATPSASLTPSPTPRASSLASPKTSLIPSPVLTGTPSPNASTSANTIPVTGTALPTLVLMSLGVLSILFGVFGSRTEKQTV